VGWKGTMRSVGAAMRAADREAKRRERERDRRQRADQKAEAIRQAAEQVAEFEAYVRRLTTLHTKCGDRIDWEEIAIKAAPPEPTNDNAAEAKATANLDNFKPSIFTKALGGEDRARKRLSDAIDKARAKDQKRFERTYKRWQADMEEWTASSGLAQKVLAGDPDAKIEAVRKHNRFAEISDLGSGVSVSVQDTGLVEATVSVHGAEIIPDEVYSQLQSGRLSVKKMPKGRFNELHQDYVCSCVLRVANEVFAILPDETVIVTATDEILNSATGHKEELPIVSACVSNKTFSSLNLSRIDPSDSFGNFLHNMDFKKTVGFKPVTRVALDPAGK